MDTDIFQYSMIDHIWEEPFLILISERKYGKKVEDYTKNWNSNFYRKNVIYARPSKTLFLESFMNFYEVLAFA